jgi:hypothetical protein
MSRSGAPYVGNFHNNDINTIAAVIAFSLDLEYEIFPDSGIFFREKR